MSLPHWSPTTVFFFSYGQQLFVPFAYGRPIPSQRPADFAELLRVAKLGAEALNETGGPAFKVGQPVQFLYPSSGGSMDWAKAVANITYSFLFELRDDGTYGFLLPASLIEQSGAETLAGIVAMIRAIA